MYFHKEKCCTGKIRELTRDPKLQIGKVYTHGRFVTSSMFRWSIRRDKITRNNFHTEFRTATFFRVFKDFQSHRRVVQPRGTVFRRPRSFFECNDDIYINDLSSRAPQVPSSPVRNSALRHERNDPRAHHSASPCRHRRRRRRPSVTVFSPFII